YGLLLDQSGVEWRKSLKPKDDLGELLRSALGLSLPALDKGKIDERVREYDGDALKIREVKRDQQRRAIAAKDRAQFVDGPILFLPLQKMQFSFDPNTTRQLDGHGTVYPTLQLSDVWGTLKASKGVLLTADFQKAIIKAPGDPGQQPLRGD